MSALSARAISRPTESFGQFPMEMHQVRYFLAVTQQLNFTRAAESCNVAQPSLTRAIKQLESELGGELFRRERNLSHLTELGHRVLPILQQCYVALSGLLICLTLVSFGDPQNASSSIRNLLARGITTNICGTSLIAGAPPTQRRPVPETL